MNNIDGNNNTVINNNSYNNSEKPKRKKGFTLATIATIVTILGGLIGIYEKYYNNLEDDFYKKENTGSVISVKPEKESSKKVILNKLEIALQETKRIKYRSVKDAELKRIVNECIPQNKYNLAIEAAKSASRNQRDILLEYIINKSLLEEKNYQYARKAVDFIKNSKKRNELQIIVAKAFNK